MKASQKRGYSRPNILTSQTQNEDMEAGVDRILMDASHGSHGFKIKAAKPAAKPYHLTDGHGLFLVVQPTGRSSGVGNTVSKANTG